MKQALVKEFQARIINAGRGELLIINYEMLLAQLDDALEAAEVENGKAFIKAMNSADKLLRELSSGLDFKYDIAKELMSIYIYINKKFVEAKMKMDTAAVLETRKILQVLLKGWKMTEFEDEAPVVANGQKVYAGLTYGKSSLNEMTDMDYNRGFRA